MNNKLPFNKPVYIGDELQYIQKAIKTLHLSGNGMYGVKCEQWFEHFLPVANALMTPSCTHALEMAALLVDIQADDEVIMPSYTFVSTANAFVLRGAKIVFVDIRPDTMNIDETKIEAAITSKTKAIVPVHYAGVSCEMDTIMALAKKHNLFVIEDAAQGMMSTYKGKALGTIGHLGTYSFHETKNYTSGGEGGLLLVNDDRFIERAEIIREKGTNRNKFFRGEVDKYSWIDLGSSYLPSELQAAYLYAQLQFADKINKDRLASWEHYYAGLHTLQQKGLIELPVIPDQCCHNGHMFYIKVKDLQERSLLLQFLQSRDVMAVFHYVPLHTSAAGLKFGRFSGVDTFTTKESERLIRLPMYYGLTKAEQQKVMNSVIQFYT